MRSIHGPGVQGRSKTKHLSPARVLNAEHSRTRGAGEKQDEASQPGPSPECGAFTDQGCRDKQEFTMNKLINIGFGNLVNASRVVAVVSPDSAPIKRIVLSARDGGMLIDATQGRRTRAVIIMSDDHIVLSALLPETIASRHQGKETADSARYAQEEDEDE